MTPSRPYFVRAIHEWLNDNALTAYVLVDATRAGVQVPAAFVKDGRIVLNIAPGAVRDLFLHNDAISFSARFGGVPMQVHVPMVAVLAIYARENGQGMFFDEEDYPEGAPEALPAGETPTVAPVLSAVRAGETEATTGGAGKAEATAPGASEDAGLAGGSGGEGDEPEPPRPGGGRPSLRVVK